jgi:hypothetical protein
MMSLMTHLVELSEKHKALERKIQDEQGRPSADPIRLKLLKSEKLRIKDEIERIRSETRH